MVRLKGMWLIFWKPLKPISIPYRSIKSIDVIAKSNNTFISIPYGSIKSRKRQQQRANCCISIPYGSIKSELRKTHLTKCLISIPYGSIKSDNYRHGQPVFLKFQFLMVRLKAISTCFSISRFVISIPYGSIKRKSEDRKGRYIKISIPYGSIKRPNCCQWWQL